MSVWAAISTVISLLALMTALAAFWVQRRQADFTLACTLHRDLTTGEVAEARDKLGTLIHDPTRIDDRDLRQVRSAYFTLLWCFERIDVGRQVMGGSRKSSSWPLRRLMRGRQRLSGRPLRLLDELVNYPVEYWGEHLPTVRQELSARMDNTVEDDTEWKVFQRLAKDLRSRCDELPRISPNDDSVN